MAGRGLAPRPGRAASGFSARTGHARRRCSAPRPGSFPPVGRPLVPVGPGQPVGVTAGGGGGPVSGNGPGPVVPAVPFVSPRRAGAPPIEGAAVESSLPPIAPAEPVSAYPDTPGAALGPDQDDEPSVPDEARARIVADATADAPVDAGPGTVLHVNFTPGAASDRVLKAMEGFRAIMRDRPGSTRVIIHIPGPDGGPMPLKPGVAYDADMLAEVRRRLGDGLIDLRLASA